jgi:pimeloyl-ACP methyl ester carboxylesterase
VLDDLPYVEQGDGPPVLLVHAVGDSGRAFLPLLRHLPPRLRCLAPDQRGHGDAAKPESGYTVADYVQDLVRFLDRRGLESVAVVGSSSGGLVSQRLAADHPDRVTALVLAGVPHTLLGAELPDLFRDLTDPVEPDFVRGLNEGLTYRPLDPGIAEAAVVESLKAPARVWTATLEGLLAEPPPSRRAPIRARTLMLWGEHDGLLGRDQQEALLRDIPDSRLVVLPETGHVPIWECPDRVAAEIAAFV